MAETPVEIEKPPRATLRMAAIQVILTVAMLVLALRLRPDGAQPWPSRVWWPLALAAFTGGRALMNAIGYYRRSTVVASTPGATRLGVRLEPEAGEPETQLWIWFPLAIGYGPPALALAMLGLRMAAEGSDFVILVAGAALVCAVLALLGLLMGIRHIYLILSGGRTSVEVGADTLRPGQSTPLLIIHQSGRLHTVGIQASVLCRETVRVRTRGSGGKTGYRYETHVIHEAPLLSRVPFETPAGTQWEQEAVLSIPEAARASTPLDSYPTIRWTVDVAVEVSRGPDYTLKFPLTVA